MMYTRTYQDENAFSVPEGYAGTMIEPHEDVSEISEEASSDGGGKAQAASASPLSWLAGLGSGALGSLFKTPLLSNFKLGTEELLIGAVALFMLFSKDGDKECAIMLLLLLFVT